MYYKVKFPVTAEMGTGTCLVESGRSESIRAQALWDYNSSRAHDGLAPVKRLPAGTTFTPMVDYNIEADYGHGDGWERVHTTETMKEARAQLGVYLLEDVNAKKFRIMRRALGLEDIKPAVIAS